MSRPYLHHEMPELAETISTDDRRQHRHGRLPLHHTTTDGFSALGQGEFEPRPGPHAPLPILSGCFTAPSNEPKAGGFAAAGVDLALDAHLDGRSPDQSQ